ncbi:hypothetical protein ATY78_07245 [Rhizobium sp. R635]|nr:hypothetical protein ATY78_07245 [Rhizobium sp. R635]
MIFIQPNLSFRRNLCHFLAFFRQLLHLAYCHINLIKKRPEWSRTLRVIVFSQARESRIERLVNCIVVGTVHARRKANSLSLIIGRRIRNTPGSGVFFCLSFRSRTQTIYHIRNDMMRLARANRFDIFGRTNDTGPFILVDIYTDILTKGCIKLFRT